MIFGDRRLHSRPYRHASIPSLIVAGSHSGCEDQVRSPHRLHHEALSKMPEACLNVPSSILLLHPAMRDQSADLMWQSRAILGKVAKPISWCMHLPPVYPSLAVWL